MRVGAICRNSFDKSGPELCCGGGGAGLKGRGGGVGLGPGSTLVSGFCPLWSQQKVPFGQPPFGDTMDGGAQRESITSGIHTPGHLFFDPGGGGGLVGGGGGLAFLRGFFGGGGRSGRESGLEGRGGLGGDLVIQHRPWGLSWRIRDGGELSPSFPVG